MQILPYHVIIIFCIEWASTSSLGWIWEQVIFTRRTQFCLRIGISLPLTRNIKIFLFFLTWCIELSDDTREQLFWCQIWFSPNIEIYGDSWQEDFLLALGLSWNTICFDFKTNKYLRFWFQSPKQLLTMFPPCCWYTF